MALNHPHGGRSDPLAPVVFLHMKVLDFRELLERKLRRREQRVAGHRPREAHFADIKTLEQIDWTAMEGVSKRTILELATCAFIGKTEDVVIAGPIERGSRT